MAEITLEERFDKIRSPNLESQKQTAIVLKAVESTLKEQNAETTPTAYFAALLALLTQSTGADAAKKTLDAPIIYLLDLVTPYAPHGLLRAKFTQILTALAPVLLQQDAEAPLLRSSIGCLESLLLAQDSAAWELSAAQISPRRAVAGLLKLSVDPRPKVRKRALEAVRKVLDAPPPGPTLDHPASAMCAETAMASLRDLAQRAQQTKKDKRQGGHGGGGGGAGGSQSLQHDPELFHALQLVRSIAASSGGWPTKKIEALCELLLGIARTGNDHMSVAVLEVFEMIFQGMTDDIAASKLTRLLEIIAELRPAPNDTQLLPPWIAVLSRGYDVSAQVEPEDTFYKLPELFEMVSPYLESPSGNIRVSASECLISFLANCVPKQAVLEPSVYDEKTFEKLAKIAGDYLSVRYQAAMEEVFNVLAALYDAFRWRADPFLLQLTKTIGDMRGSDAFAAKKEADKLLGHAIRAIGPASILKVLPLNLAQPSAQQPGRAWLLPLFRDFTTNTNLADFRSEFVPLSNALFQRVLDNGEAEKTTEVKIFETIVQQIWSILPGFCDLPLDLTAAFDASFGELLANLLYQQVNLRFDICRALKALVESNEAVATLADEEDDLFVQCRVSKAQAKANLAHLGTFSSQYLAVLFNVYGQTLAQSRGPILQTINAFLSVTPQSDLVKSFDEVCRLLATALQEATAAAPAAPSAKTESGGGANVPSTSHTLMDLVITMALHLPRESYLALFQIASLAVVKDDDPQLQKKAYKMIPRLAGSEVGRVALVDHHEELQQLMITSADKVSAPARRERLAALAALLPLVPNHALHFIPSILSEVVISCKEQNERARASAFELLVVMGEKMSSADGAVIDNSKVPTMADDAPSVVASLEEFFTMVSAGLAGSTPHMISASITAITRILYEFRTSLDRQALDDLVQTVELFLTSNNREIVRSVLGFVKVCIISLPADMMRPRLPTLVPNLMVWSHEHKSHFRAKVKHILDRMVRRFGDEIVSKNCPEQDRKLIANIRKTKERNKRKKKATNEAGGNGSGDEDENATSGQARKPRVGRFESEFDEALYSSDSGDSSGDNSDGDEDGDTGGRGPRNASRNKRSAKGGQAFIMEEEGEPLDLLDRQAMASISSTRPVKLRKPTKDKAKYNADGKLVLGGDDDADADVNANDGMDIDAQNDDGGSGVNAYMAAVSGKDVPKRGLRGKLKWSNKKGGGGDGDDEVMDDADAVAIKSKLDRSPGAGRFGGRPASSGRGRGGRGGGGGGGERGHSRSGSGRVGFGRRGLGEEKHRDGGSRGGFRGGGGRVGKPTSKRH
ncbi:pre-rRNA processing protein [Niveomyces insectorum RCEF 264]|uniref:Pre-rRNA processing protein n=1 Tax=Niveomyces insectorum RCEF 264 TaxID=1081102 RepID=A0A167NUP9_9HYPO|nr:pre-rRNA processing protein [Niveomyces insectorum RCEF 264]